MEAGRKALKQRVRAVKNTWTRCYLGIPAQLVAIAMTNKTWPRGREVVYDIGGI